MSDIGKFILEHRTARNLSTRKLAALADISHTEIHRLENGERKNPSPLLLKCIANALALPYEDIMRAAGYMDIIATTTHLSGIDDLTDQEIEEVNNFIEFLRNKRIKQNSKS
ncbi:helix-turn-helix transcriptional regulator [Clostridium sp. CF012]|uniref:helix-turn-helix domain-containing protein n=1 Tax=Clostridium sp. CF012 TaxID=2843319 RepID=UPI001C0E4171|nr:helix-turn-helix domain-containing protein [Clostridium sp. CF012]